MERKIFLPLTVVVLFGLSSCDSGGITSPGDAHQFVKNWMPNDMMAFLFCSAAAIAVVAFLSLFFLLITNTFLLLVRLKKWLFNPFVYISIIILILLFEEKRNEWPDWAWEWYQAHHPVYMTKGNDIFVNDTSYAISGIGPITEQTIVDAYLDKLKKNTSETEKDSIINLLNELQKACKLRTVLSLYEPLDVECGLNPFRVRDDGKAAGLIQFTTAGLGNVYYQGKKVSLDDVKRCCAARDIAMMCSITRSYLMDKYKRFGPFDKYIDIYIAIFAPAHTGKDDTFPLYEGKENDKYYLNDGFDGWYLNEAGQILYSKKMKDYKITIMEVKLTVIARRERLVKAYLQKFKSNSHF